VINAATKTVVVVTTYNLTWLWGIWVTQWSLRISWNTQRVNFATNSFHVL
jgi:hypothetical protein